MFKFQTSVFFSFSGNDEKFKKVFENESIPNIDGAIVKVECEVDFHSSIDIIKKEEDCSSPPFIDVKNVHVKEEKDFKFTPFIEIKKEEKSSSLLPFTDVNVKEEEFISTSSIDIDVKKEEAFSCPEIVSSNCI